jgi:hypothetical protein
MRAARLQEALERLTAAIRDVESELAAMKAEHDPPRVAHLCFAPILSERKRYEKRKAPRDDGAPEFQYCLRAWLLRQPRRMGAPHGSSCEAMNDLSLSASENSSRLARTHAIYFIDPDKIAETSASKRGSLRRGSRYGSIFMRGL